MESIVLNSNQINSPFQIGAATNNNDDSITPSELEISFDQDNSNIDELVEIQPNTFNFEYEIITNNDINQELGFAYKGQGIKSELQMKIPFYGSLQDITFSDTVDVDFTLPSDLEEGSFRVRFSTSPQNQSVKFYSDYAVKLKLTGNFNYTVGQ